MDREVLTRVFQYPGVPDSRLARTATELVAEVSPEFLVNHCVRTYLYADALRQRDGLKVDSELLYLGCIMHDLGLTEQYNGNQRFEVDGADAARSFLLAHGLPESKAETVWDAIALHSSLGIALRKQPEIALLSLAAGTDVAGLGLDQISKPIVEEILATFPRMNLQVAFTELLVSHVRSKPQVLPLTWLAEVGRLHAPDVPIPSFDDFMRNSPYQEWPQSVSCCAIVPITSPSSG